MNKTIIILIINQSFTLSLFAQVKHTIYEQFTTKQGLSHNTVYSIIQDHHGFMWFGTEVGLNKYDGYNFLVWQEDLPMTDKISHQNTGNLMIDSEGIIWIGSWRSGLIRFDPSTNTYKQFKNDPENSKSISGNRIQTLLQDSQGYYWFGTYQNGLNRFDSKTEIFQNLRYEAGNSNNLSHNRIWSIIEGPDGNIWTGTGDGLDILDPDLGVVEKYKNNPNYSNSLVHNEVRTLLLLNNDLWIGTFSGISLFDIDKKNFRTYDCSNTEGLPCGMINKLYFDRESILWVGTEEGLIRYKIDKENNLLNFPLSNKLIILNNAFIRDIYEDDNQVLWVSTDDLGIFKINNSKAKFNLVQKGYDQFNSINNNNVTSVYEDHSGVLWIGTNGGGLYKYNPSTDKYTAYVHDPIQKTSIGSNKVFAIHEDEKKQLWIGTFSGLDKYDRTTDGFLHYPVDKLDEINAITEDLLGNLWLGTYKNGLFRLDSGGSFTHFVNDLTDENSLGHQEIWSLFVDRENNLWIGTGDGLDYFDQTNKTFYHFRDDPESANSIEGFRIKDIHGDVSGALWIGTDEGLNKFDIHTQTFTQYSLKDGLPSNLIESILEDENGNLWLGTNNGLSKFDPYNGSITNYDMDDGLQDKEFYFGANFKSKDGRMYFGGINGFNNFHPDSVEDYKIPPVVRFTSFNKYGKSTEKINNISYSDQLELSYKDKVFSIEFAALDYRAPQMNKYAYKLDEFHDHWIETDYKNRKVTFTGLSAGNYTFRVRASNSDNYWNETGTSINIIISPPWWQTLGFRVFVMLTIILLVLAIFRIRNQVSRKRKKELEIKVKKRTIELTQAKETAEDAKRSLEFAQFAIDNTDVMVYWVNIETAQILYCNHKAANQLGYSHEEMLGMTLPEIDVEINMKMWPKWVQNLKFGKSLEFESAQKTKSGEHFPVEILAEYVMFGNEERIIAFGRDITERKKARKEIQKAKETAESTLIKLKETQTQLIQSEKMSSLGQLTAGVAHELNNPINAIHIGIIGLEIELLNIFKLLGNYEKLEKNSTDNQLKDKIQEQKTELNFSFLKDLILTIIKDMKVGSMRTVNIVKGLQKFSRIGGDVKEQTDIHECIEESLKLLRSTFKNKVEIIMDFDLDLGKVYCYKNELNQVFLNLLTNAEQSIVSKGKISISTRKNEKFIFIIISDDGRGMDNETAQKIFDPFYTTKPVGKGTGLGLSSSFGIIQKHGGKIEVNSELGKGSEFKIILPVDNSTD